MYVKNPNAVRGHRQLKGGSKNGARHHKGRPAVEVTAIPLPARDVRLEGLSSYTTTRPAPRFGDLFHIPTNGEAPIFLIPKELMIYIH